MIKTTPKQIDSILARLASEDGFDERTMDGDIHNLVHGTRYIRVPSSVTGFHTAIGDNGCPTVPHYTTSTDPLFALIARSLPDWRVENLCEWDHTTLRARGAWTSDLMRRGKDFSHMRSAKCPHAPTAAMALLIAILHAIRMDLTSSWHSNQTKETERSVQSVLH